MADNDLKKYWYIKLPRDFFNRHDVKILESMPNGKDYCLFYLKLLLESVSHNGELRFDEMIPYDENMISVVTNTNVDVVRTAMTILEQLHLVELWDDKTIYMTEVNKLIGVETGGAIRKREYRERQKGTLSQNCPQELDIEKDIEKDIDIDINNKETTKESEWSARGKTEKELVHLVSITLDKYKIKNITDNELTLWIKRGCLSSNGYPVEDIEKYLISWSSRIQRKELTDGLYKGIRNN